MNLLKDCLPWILDRDTLMAGWWEFMTKELVKERCVQCVQKNTCLQVIDLLNNNNFKEAEKLLIWK